MSALSSQLGQAARYLPPDLMHLIFARLSLRDMYYLSLASKHMWKITTPYLWRCVDSVDQIANLLLVSSNVDANAQQSGYQELESTEEMVSPLYEHLAPAS